MKKLFAALKSAPKRTAALAVVAAAVFVPAALYAWGPDRPTFTLEKPAPYVTFNSMTNNQKHGDERNFVQIRNASDNGKFGENVDLTPGKEYEVYVFYHNNAASNLNDAAHDYKGIAQNAFMRVQMPASVTAGQNARVTGFVGASNAKPAQVWDEAYGKNTSTGDVALRYVPNSAKITNLGATNGQSIDLNKLTSATGTPLGYDKLDGKLPGCNEFSGYVTYRFKVDQPNFEVQKTVSASGQNQYQEQVTAKPGAEVEYKIKYKNNGTTAQNNVSIRDKLPAGVSYVANSTMYSSSKTGNQWAKVDSNDVVTRGVDFGAFAPGGALYVKFKAKIVDNDKLEKCGVNTLINTATAETPNGGKSDTANVVVTKECQPPVEKIKACNTETGKIEEVEKGKENTPPYTTDLSKCEEKPPVEMVEACNTETGKIERVEKGKENTAPYTTDLEKCQPKPPVTPEEPETPVTPEQPTPEQPVTELPTTGAADTIVSFVGLGSLIAAASYYVASRRALN